jgi:phytoene desaturase
VLIADFMARAKVIMILLLRFVYVSSGVSPLELITPKTAMKVGEFFNISRDVRKKFKNKS